MKEILRWTYSVLLLLLSEMAFGQEVVDTLAWERGMKQNDVMVETRAQDVTLLPCRRPTASTACGVRCH